MLRAGGDSRPHPPLTSGQNKPPRFARNGSGPRRHSPWKRWDDDGRTGTTLRAWERSSEGFVAISGDLIVQLGQLDLLGFREPVEAA
jgi:hypothetical protein